MPDILAQIQPVGARHESPMAAPRRHAIRGDASSGSLVEKSSTHEMILHMMDGDGGGDGEVRGREMAGNTRWDNGPNNVVGSLGRDWAWTSGGPVCRKGEGVMEPLIKE